MRLKLKPTVIEAAEEFVMKLIAQGDELCWSGDDFFVDISSKIENAFKAGVAWADANSPVNVLKQGIISHLENNECDCGSDGQDGEQVCCYLHEALNKINQI